VEENIVQDHLAEIQSQPEKPWLKIALFSVLGLVLVGGLIFAAVKVGVPSKPQPKACSTEAKICPDGSAVGRTGPNCEFAPCPNQVTQDETANWKTYTNTKFGFSVKYPNSWFSNSCGSDQTLILDPSSSIVCETEPYNPIVLVANDDSREVSEIAKGWLPDFKITPLESVPITAKNSKYLVEKVQPAPGPEKLIIIYFPIKKGTFIIYVNNIQYGKVADQILSTFRFLE
jgi:hypothetical protein